MNIHRIRVRSYTAPDPGGPGLKVFVTHAGGRTHLATTGTDWFDQEFDVDFDSVSMVELDEYIRSRIYLVDCLERVEVAA